MKNPQESEFFDEVSEKRRILKDRGDAALRSIEIDLDEIKEDSIKIGKKVLIIGGALLAGYTLYRLISPAEKNEEDDLQQKSGHISKVIQVRESRNPLVGQLSGMALALALEYARRRLFQYLDSLDEEKDKAG